MANKTIVKKQWSLQSRDWWNGLLIAVITAVLFSVQKTIEAGTLSFDWREIAMGAVAAIAAYVLKNLTEPDAVINVTTGQEAKDIIKQKEATE